MVSTRDGWTRLACGIQACLRAGVPVCLRFDMAEETPALLADARLELFMATGCLVAQAWRAEASDGAVIVALRLRGGASCR